MGEVDFIMGFLSRGHIKYQVRYSGKFLIGNGTPSGHSPLLLCHLPENMDGNLKLDLVETKVSASYIYIILYERHNVQIIDLLH